jgi:hypothetical protein
MATAFSVCRTGNGPFRYVAAASRASSDALLEGRRASPHADPNAESLNHGPWTTPNGAPVP